MNNIFKHVMTSQRLIRSRTFSHRQCQFVEQPEHGDAAAEQAGPGAGRQVREQQPADARVQAEQSVLRGTGGRDRHRAGRRHNSAAADAEGQPGDEQVPTQRARLAADADGQQREPAAPDRLGGAGGNGGQDPADLVVGRQPGEAAPRHQGNEEDTTGEACAAAQDQDKGLQRHLVGGGLQLGIYRYRSLVAQPQRTATRSVSNEISSSWKRVLHFLSAKILSIVSLCVSFLFKFDTKSRVSFALLILRKASRLFFFNST